MKCFNLLCALIFLTTPRSAVAEDLTALATFVSSRDLADIATSLASDNGPQWPEIASTEVEKNPEKGRIASILLKKILEADIANPQGVVPALSSLSRTLQSSGGYGNYVIADTARRFAVASLIRALAKGVMPPEEAERLADFVPPAFPTTHEWTRLLNQEIGAGKGGELLHTQPEEQLTHLYALSGETDVGAIYVRIGEQSATSEKLLKGRDIAVLALKMAQTETFRAAYFRALVWFLTNGGDLREVDLGDVRKVNAVLAKAPEFSSALLRLRRVNALHLKLMADESATPEAESKLLVGYE